MTWTRPNSRKKKFKIMIYGPPGCFKTRIALRLGDNKNFDKPSNGVIDTEFGTDHYVDQFAFVVPPIKAEDMNAETIHGEVFKLVKNPGDLKTLTLDSSSVYMDMVKEYWMNLFKLREKTSAGNKLEYYTMQPRDHDPLNAYVGKFIRTLLKCDMNIIVTAQKKNLWDNAGDKLKVIGETFDAWKRLPYYFDTVIEVFANTKTGPKEPLWLAKVAQKDRSHSFKVGEIIPWGSDEEAYNYMVKKMGHDLSGGEKSVGYDVETDTSVSTDVTSKPVTVATAATPEPVTPVTPVTPVASPEKPAPAATAVQTAVIEPVVEAAPEPEVSGPVKHETLVEIVRVKKEAKINDPVVWGKLVAMFNKPDGTPHTSAKEMTENVARELIKSIIRGELPT